MRELLFRGFHPCGGPDTIVVDGERVTGRWVLGSLISFSDGGCAILPSKTIALQQEGTTLLSTKECLEVLPSTVGQYTGLKDKNGKRVFEGSIISIANPKPFVPWVCEVMYEDCCFWLKDNREVIRMLADYDDSEIEVIGTVFDEGAGN